MKLVESEIRSIIQSELRRTLNERSNMGGMELSLLIGDAMLDGLRDVVISAARNPDVQVAVQSAGQVDHKKLAEKIVYTMLNDRDFQIDLISLVASMVKRASKK